MANARRLAAKPVTQRWAVAGSCSRCGLCCKPPVVVDGPCIVRGQDRCLFYEEAGNSERFGHCLIVGHTGNVEDVCDRFGVKITSEQVRWFKANCPHFPTANLAELVAGKFSLPDGCTYRVIQIG